MLNEKPELSPSFPYFVLSIYFISFLYALKQQTLVLQTLLLKCEANRRVFFLIIPIITYKTSNCLAKVLKGVPLMVRGILLYLILFNSIFQCLFDFILVTHTPFLHTFYNKIDNFFSFGVDYEFVIISVIV